MSFVIAAVKSVKVIEKAVSLNVDTIFWLAPNINTLQSVIDVVHEHGKKLYIHMDMAEGIGKDKFGVKFAHDLGVDGIISTRSNIIKYAKDLKLSTVQRFFAIDSQSIETIIETVKNTGTDMIEIMPGTNVKAFERVKESVNVPIIAGGLIENEDEVKTMLEKGAFAISTGEEDLWNFNK